MRASRYLYEEAVTPANDPFGDRIWQAKGMVLVWIRQRQPSFSWDMTPATHAEMSYRLVTRYRDDIRVGGRFSQGDKHLYIRSVHDPDGRRRRLMCLCVQAAMVPQSWGARL